MSTISRSHYEIVKIFDFECLGGHISQRQFQIWRMENQFYFYVWVTLPIIQLFSDQQARQEKYCNVEKTTS